MFHVTKNNDHDLDHNDLNFMTMRIQIMDDVGHKERLLCDRLHMMLTTNYTVDDCYWIVMMGQNEITK